MKSKTLNSNTCVLYFTTGKIVEKSFSLNKRKSFGVQRALFNNTLNEIKNSKISYQITDGATFGADIFERLNGSIARVFELGFEQVILLGDDTPELSAVHIRQASNHLEHGKLNIGPSKDGGIYLIAFNKADFNRGILDSLTWHSSSFYQQLTENLEKAGISFEILKALDDLDTAFDVSVFLNRNLKSQFFKTLQSFFLPLNKIFNRFKFNSHQFSESALYRGPPQVD